MISVHFTQNKILNSLIQENPILCESIDLVQLKKSKSILRTGLREDTIYFPIDALLASVTSDGLDCALFDYRHSTWIDPHSALFLCRSSGYAYQVSRALLQSNDVLHGQCMRYHMAVVNILSYFSTHYSHDRLVYYLSLLPANRELDITQEEIGWAVGTRRETVTEFFPYLIERGIMIHRRGHIVIQDSDKLLEMNKTVELAGA
jgi:hypothetical protein